jgi:hypothetical protein
MVGVEHQLTLAYSSEENAIVERQNKELNRHLRALTFDRTIPGDYKTLLPFVQRIMNSSINANLQASPAQLLFGNAVNLDRDIFIPVEASIPQERPVGPLVDNMLAQQQALMKIATKCLLTLDHAHVAAEQSEPTYFPPGSYVLVQYLNTLNGQAPSRTHTPWRGPLRVISVDAKNRSTYTLLDLVTNRTRQYHACHMKPFHFDPLTVNPLDIAIRDSDHYVVERILRHKGNTKLLNTLEFFVLWKGFDQSEASWVPWSNLRTNARLHEYLHSQNLDRLIPRQFRS